MERNRTNEEFESEPSWPVLHSPSIYKAELARLKPVTESLVGRGTQLPEPSCTASQGSHCLESGM